MYSTNEIIFYQCCWRIVQEVFHESDCYLEICREKAQPQHGCDGDETSFISKAQPDKTFILHWNLGRVSE